MLGGLLVLVLVAAVAGAMLLGTRSKEATSEERTYPTAWDPRVAPIAEWVADERDLLFEHPVEVVFQPEEEYLADAGGDPAETSEEDQQSMEDFVATLRALGLLEGEVDLAEAAGDLSSEGTLAYYDPQREMVFVRGDELTPAVRVTVAHELTHVLQDQHFDLGRLSDPDFAAHDGLRAMAEGDAGRIEDAYAADVLTAEERAEYEEETASSVDDGEAALAGVPPVLSITFGAPYVLGEGFLTYREMVDGGQPWDAVLRDPPAQEDLLDPAAWETERSEETAVEVAAPEGAEVLDESTFDPLTWYLLLASRGEPEAALRAVDGWGGDAYVAYRRDGVVCATMAVTGDDAPSTDVLHRALVDWAAGGPDGGATVELVDGTIEVTACDPGPEAAATGIVTEQLLAVPAFRAGLEATVVAQGATHEQARCASDAVLAALSIEQLTATAADPATQQVVQQAVAGCL